MRRLIRRSQFVCKGMITVMLAACGGGGGGGGVIDPAESSIRTQQSAGELLRGSDDFASMAGNLRQAVALDPSNSAARVFLGFAEFLAALDRLAVEPSGRVRSLGERLGYVDTSVASGLWSFRAERMMSPLEGEYPANGPRMNEYVTSLEHDLLPMLNGFIALLQTIPSDFSWMIAASDIAQHPAGQGTTPSNPVYEFDYGEIRLLSAALRVSVAMVDLALAYSGANLDFNDFDRGDDPALDALQILRDSYPGLGNVTRPAMVTACRDQLEAAFGDYEAAANHLRLETPARQAIGLVSLSPDRLSTGMTREEILYLEQSWRQWLAAFVIRFRTNVPYVITTGPDGMPKPPQEHVAINLYRLFQGINFRDIYFRIVEHPRLGSYTLGVMSLTQVDANMLTIGGVLVSLGGQQPRVGDAQAHKFVLLRVDNPPQSVKTIDGDFSDWDTDSLKVADEPTEVTETGPLHLGNLYACVGDDQLFLRLDRNYLDLVNRPSGTGYAKIQVDYYDPLQWFAGDHVAFWSGSTEPSGPWNGAGANNALGMEASFSIPAGFGTLWAVVSIEVDLQDPSWSFPMRNTRDQIFIRLR